ncbi:glycosyl transferase family 2 [Kushneria sinocarnis]|uniref:Glycosyl transferase family 2 n=1 Tax=Kushneria sinocarnis TaxID=595502 RepID=A0A420WVV2_9GAMM|nr:glycosyltransferase [Kushneria sinocarnis]RKR03251.1 glycosyl transferase family 2 [Kushneria sinocarnis]
MPEFRLSLILAAYNLEDLIETALGSIMPQLHDDMELVIIDDGSTDSTREVIRRYLGDRLEEKRIRLIEQANGGISAARNTGVEAARGAYIAFLDGDDLLLPGYSDTLTRILDESTTPPDIVEFNAIRFDRIEGEQFINSYPFNTTVIAPHQGEASADTFKRIFSHGWWFLWARIYRRELLAGLSFPPGRRYEDMSLLPEIYLRAVTITAIDTPLIAYRCNSEGITRNPSSKDLEDIECIIDHYLAMAKEATDDLTRTLALYVAFQATLFYKNINNDMYGYRRALPNIRRMVNKVGALRRRHPIELPFNTRALFLSPELSNFYSFLKSTRFMERFRT